MKSLLEFCYCIWAFLMSFKTHRTQSLLVVKKQQDIGIFVVVSTAYNLYSLKLILNCQPRAHHLLVHSRLQRLEDHHRLHLHHLPPSHFLCPNRPTSHHPFSWLFSSILCVPRLVAHYHTRFLSSWMINLRISKSQKTNLADLFWCTTEYAFDASVFDMALLHVNWCSNYSKKFTFG